MVVEKSSSKFLVRLVLAFTAYASIAGAQPGISEPVRRRIYRIGEEVSAPELIARTAPAYSDELRNARTQGAVVLVFVVDPSGIPVNVQISHGLSKPADKAAAHALDSWRFTPAQRRGEPVAVRAAVEVQFGPWLGNRERRSAPIGAEDGASWRSRIPGATHPRLP